MAGDTKISVDPAASALTGTEVAPVVQSGANVKATINQIKAYILAAANTFTATQTLTPAANTEALTISGASLTGSNASSFASIAGTWNTSGTPTAIKLTVTDTASNAASLFLDLRTSGGSVFNISKAGAVTATGQFFQSDFTAAAPSMARSASANSGMGIDASNNFGIAKTGSLRFGMDGASLYVRSDALLTWNSTTTANIASGNDTFLGRLAAASIRLGDVPSATPVAQALTIGEASIGGTNTDVAGATGTIQSGLGTGAGAASKILIRVPVVAASSSTQQSYGTAITVNASTATGLQFNGYGAGSITSDGSGNLTAASDPRMKHIQRQFTPGLAELRSIKPIVYKWREDSGMEPDNEYAGFDARNVRDAVPMATWEGSDGALSLQDRALLAACVNAINELAAR